MGSELIEVAKAIAMLCAISAGDKPGLANMVDLISMSQVTCQSYYSRCLQTKYLARAIPNKGDWGVDLISCMATRR